MYVCYVINVCMYVRMYVCLDIYVYVYTQSYTYIYYVSNDVS